MNTLKSILLSCLFSLTASVVGAQIHIGHSGLAHGIPDFCATDGTALNILAGQTRTLSGPLTISCLGIHGSVTLAADLMLTVETIIVYDDGSLTVADGARAIWRDTPLDLVTDPEQFSHGLIGLGKIRMNGAAVTPFVRLSSDVPQFTSTLVLQVPADWKIGQRLEVPDTRQLAPTDLVPGSFFTTISARQVDQGEVCTIAAILPMGVTCAQPMQYAHPGAHSPAMNGQPAIDLYPHVANITRGIVFRSENPNGVRGHALFSQRADVQIRGAAFVDMGRTTGKKLNDTTFDAAGAVTHVGTNQRARYPLHFHHVFGVLNSPDPYQFQVIDSVIEHGNKWGLSVHNTSWGLVQDNVCVDVSGSCYLTEDGDETNNVFDHNFGASVENRQFDLPMNTYDPENNRGSVFWFRGVNQRVTRNVAYAARSGFAWYTGNDENPPLFTVAQQRIPKFRGADTTLDANVTYDVTTQSVRLPMLPIEDNEAAGMSAFGLEFWWTEGAIDGLRPTYTAVHPPNSTVKRSTVWHVGGVDSTNTFQGAGISIHYTDLEFDGIVAVNENGFGLALVGVNDGGGIGLGHGFSRVQHADVRGFKAAWQHGGQIGLPVYWGFADSFFQTTNGFVYTNVGESGGGDASADGFGHDVILTTNLEWRNVRFASTLGNPLKTIQPVFIKDTARAYEGSRRIRVNVTDYQGVPGDNFRVYFTGQAPDAPAPLFLLKSVVLTHDLGCPEILTNQQCWDKYHMATTLQVAPANATTKPEISGLIGPSVIDQPDPVVAVPPPPGQLPVVPFSCPECVTAVTFDGVNWTLGPETTPPGNDRVVMRGAGPHADSKAIAYLLFGGKLYVYNKSVARWFEWLPKAVAFSSVPDPRPASPAPVDCQLTAWLDIFGPWVPINPGLEQRTHHRHRDVITQASGGGLACGPTDEDLAQETRTVALPPPLPACQVYPLTPKISLTVCQ